tara:strand:- start:39 stop:287 length:249 start_codon:yes stop_codon:yes gene_type:complete
LTYKEQKRIPLSLIILKVFLEQGWIKKMAKSATILIKLESTADTGYYYVTKKNPRNQTEKLEFRKYDPVARKHVLFKEGRIK